MYHFKYKLNVHNKISLILVRNPQSYKINVLMKLLCSTLIDQEIGERY